MSTACANQPDVARLLATQREAFKRGAPDVNQRRENLVKLREAIKAYREEIVAAVDRDFGGRSESETLALEIFPLLDQIRYTKRRLKAWMRRKSVASAWFLLPSRAYWEYQPLGVVGVIGAWNYPVLLTLGPLLEALAAGNHVMLKPSELAPATADMLVRLIRETFPPDYVTIVTGGAEVAENFTAQSFDHLFFTGSSAVGRKVMRAAAASLTPVTLELGGKSPAIIHADYPLKIAVERILAAKLYNAGQTCVAPDYVLLPEGREAEFEALARKIVARLYPRFADNPDYTRIINDDHFKRLSALLEEARNQTGKLIELRPSGERERAGDRLIYPTLVFSPEKSSGLMQEEIFGPILPILTYRNLDEAVAFVNARPHPLALYYFDDNSRRQDEVLKNTQSGGVTFNDCLFHLAQHNLPFGGIGASGMGDYHGYDGFVTFSKKRAVMVQRRLASTSMLRPPWKSTRWLLHRLINLMSR